jgi:predicted anti-sigma-YlaC factor YlaD
MKAMLEFLRLLTLPCEGITGLLSRDLDGQTSRAHRVAFRIHLLYCTACRRYRRHLRILRAALRRLGEDFTGMRPLPGSALPADARARMAAFLRDQG